MPLQRCQANGSRGWKWGNRGKCYTGEGAKARASRQARAIRASGYTGNARRRVRTQIVASNPLKADPTRSATLRRIFETEFTKRFAALKSKILRLVVDEDAFGLRRNLTLFNEERENDSGSRCNNAKSVDVGLPGDKRKARRAGKDTGQDRGEGGSASTQAISRGEGSQGYNRAHSVIVGNQRWAFQSSPQKVQAFQNWLAAQVQADIITTAAENVERAYWQRYVEEGYRKGAGRAFDDTRKVALQDQGAVSDFYQGTKDEFLRSSFAQPIAIEKVQLLAGRVYTDLKGVTEAMAAGMSRTLADGLVQGKNPREIARDLNKVVDGIGKRRARLIARTEIIRAHAEGQLDAFERLGVDKLGVMAEWSTAGDDRVCELCESLEGVVLDIKEARGILPRHPQCRCAYVPANVGESGAGQKRSKAEVQKAMNDSLRAEMPKRTKRTLAEQKRRSKWAGADKTIAKVRPKSILEPTKVAPKVSPKPAPKPTAIPKVKADKRKLGAGEKVEGVAGPNVPVVSRVAMLPSGVKTKLADPTKLTLLDDGKSIYHYTPSRNLKAISKEGLGSGKAKRAALGREADEGADFLYGLKSTDPTMFDEGLGMDLTPEAFNQEWAVLRIKPKGGRKLWQVDPEFADDFGEVQAIRRKMVVSPKEIEVLGDKGWQPL